MLKHLIQGVSPEILEEAMLYCSIRELYSINDLKSAAEYMGQYELDEAAHRAEISPLTNPTIVQIHTQKRKLSEYELLGGEDDE